MNLYNLLFEHGSSMSLLLNMLDLKNERNNIRIRDCLLNADGTQILLYTRNGGGNRQHYGDFQNDGSDERPEGPDCSCYGCCIKYDLSRHPHYIKDEDDSFDSTYAVVWFRVPHDFLDITKDMATSQEPETVGEKFKAAYEKIQSGDKEMKEKLMPIMEQIFSTLKTEFKKPQDKE